MKRARDLRDLLRVLRLSALAGVAISCATIGPDGRGDVDLPSGIIGPFRPLKRNKTCDGDVCTGVDELPSGTSSGSPRYPGAPPSRSPSVLVRGAGGDDLHVVLYVARDLDADTDRIARFEALDARSFADVTEVLTGDAPYEAGKIGDPSAIDVEGRVVLYYSIHPLAAADPGAAAQTPGIARAHSTDGLAGRTFEKDGLVLGIDGAKGAWETDPPRAPSLVRDNAGLFHLFYASGNAIGEATSTDGLHFTRVDGDPTTPGLDPVLSPSPVVDPATLPVGVKPPFDDLAVDDPSVVREPTVDGRPVYRLHYTGRDRRKGSAIGYAGRFGDSSLFDHGAGLVYGSKTILHTNAPTVARFPGLSLLFCNVDGDNAQQLAIAVAPAALKLPIKED